MAAPDPTQMVVYCRDVLPGMLIEACDVDEDLARRIGDDVLQRAEALAALPKREQDVLIAPFVEEVFDHKPLESPLDLKAKVTLVVRNSLLEQAHHDGPLDDGIIPATQYAAGPLSHLLAARRRQPVDDQSPNPFAGLAERYPRAWARLDALTDTFADGGRGSLRLPSASVPSLPDGDEVAAAPPSDDDMVTVFSAIDPRFDQRLVDLPGKAAEGDLVLYTSALSRYSRNSEKLHRILEFLLAHRATILTTNYLSRPTDVWVRRGALVKPDSSKPLAGVLDTRGLVGTLGQVGESCQRELAAFDPTERAGRVGYDSLTTGCWSSTHDRRSRSKAETVSRF
ncbi:hypothetical protein ABZ671_27265 [Micromonospora sp. NPDC006766]|uniref:hypothetical protein n=1 Tax=Micromonospora sp. NPDC006766 TaxID=3154778 RepID=UPI0033D36CFC